MLKGLGSWKIWRTWYWTQRTLECNACILLSQYWSDFGFSFWLLFMTRLFPFQQGSFSNNLLLFSLLTKSWYSQFWEMIWSVGLDTLTTAVLQYSTDNMYVQFLGPLVTFLKVYHCYLEKNKQTLFPHVKSCATDDVVGCHYNQTTRWTVFFTFSQRNKSLSLKPALAPLDNLFFKCQI